MLGESHLHVNPDGSRVLRREIREAHTYSTSKLFGQEATPMAVEVPIYGHGEKKLPETLLLIGRKWGLSIWHRLAPSEPEMIDGEEVPVEDGYFVHVHGRAYLPNTMPWLEEDLAEPEPGELPEPPRELTA